MKSEEIKAHLNKNYPEALWGVPDERNITAWKRNGGKGIVLEKPLRNLGQVDAVGHFLLETYEFRKPITIKAFHTEGDLSYRTQEELLAVIGGK